MSGALTGLRVLDLSRVLAGPWAGQTLADLGAEVIKVERRGSGDETRSYGPPFLKDTNGNETSDAAYFLCANRGKKSITLDLSRPEGQDIVRRLAQKSDILLENYKVGTLKRYGLGYDELRTLNPRLIYCSITGFGQSGPYRDHAAYDFMIQGLSGFMSITGERDDLPGGGPQKAGVAVADLMTAMYACTGILAAVYSRVKTGTGQYLDIALLDVQVAATANICMNYLVSGEVPKRWGNAHPNMVPCKAFRCSDGYIIMVGGNDRQFAKFCEIAGRSELVRDERFATSAARIRNRDALNAILDAIFPARTCEQWISALSAAGVPCGPINDMAQVFADPQIQHRDLVFEVPHPRAGKVPTIRNPIRLSETSIEYRAPPPLLGEHTREVLRELLEFDDARVDALAEAGVI
ncbi:MAG: CoA transferase [Betaproteobacteria bacterium]|nr:CoA transferase [Betaproteobacteria bacterium]